jgi:ABC-type molybdate transport system ATPase subunit
MNQERHRVIFSDHNALSGVIEAVHPGLTRVSVRVVTGNQTSIRVRWPEEAGRDLSFRVGQKVTARIPSDAVGLEVGLFRQGRQRWNRWIGRVVLVQRERDLMFVTVKLHGDDVILTSAQPIGGRAASLQTWDTVNVVVDPLRVMLHAKGPDQLDGSQIDLQRAWHADRDARIWLRARLTDIRQTSEGQLLSLDLGGAYVSAQIAPSNRSSLEWVPGERVDVQVGVWEAWNKRAHDTMAPIPCRLLYLSPPVQIPNEVERDKTRVLGWSH